MQARQPLAVSLQLAQISIGPLLLMSKQDLYTFCACLLWPDMCMVSFMTVLAGSGNG